MSVAVSGDQKMQGDNHGFRCRIPQRLPPGRPRNSAEKNKPVNYSEVVYSRPKSASRTNEEAGQNMPLQSKPARSARTERERTQPAQKKPISTLSRKPVFNENLSGNKTTNQIITVPLTNKQKQLGGARALLPVKNFSTLPDQETIKKCEDLETQDEQTGSATCNVNDDLNEKGAFLFVNFASAVKDSFTSRSEKLMHLKKRWQEAIVKFESLKDELNERQRTILALYASLRSMHQKLNGLGHKSSLPPAEELQVMNVANMTPDQLLQLCSETKRRQNDEQPENNLLNFDINKMNAMPLKLINLCEKTLAKRMEIINWLDALKNQEQGITINTLKRKINEFGAENDMLSSSLISVKSELFNDLNEVLNYLRKCVKETITLQLQSEKLTCLLSEENSKNSDLRKQIYHADQCRSYNNKNRIVELEKQLKEERVLKQKLKDHVSRAEGQVKIGEERAVQLEAALNQSRSIANDLQRTVQQLSDQNNRLQLEFDKELNKLNQSIKENTTHLEEIGDAREKLQSEKENLEKRLEELSNNYKESLENIKEEQKRNVAKIIEIEQKYYEEIEGRKKCDTQIELMCTRLVETELRYKDTANSLEEQMSLLNQKANELQAVKNELTKKIMELEEYKQNISKQKETINELENKLKLSVATEKKLKCELKEKEKFIDELQLRRKNVEDQLLERDIKMSQYEEQLSSLKSHIAELQHHWNETENLQRLPEMLQEQSIKLAEIIRENNNQAEILEKKNLELENCFETLRELEDNIKEKETIIKMLSDKELEQENIIRLLKNNLEMRAHVDSGVDHRILEKNNEIKSLHNKLEAYEQQVDQLERIILKLEEQVQQLAAQKRIDNEKIYKLEKQIAKQEAFKGSKYTNEIENPAYNLDHLIKILEEELTCPIDSQIQGNRNVDNKKRYNIRRQIRNDVVFKETLQPDSFQHETVPTKIEMGNFVKRTYEPTKNDHGHTNDIGYNKDVLSRNMPKSIQFCDSERVYTPPQLLIPDDAFNPSPRDCDVSRNLHCIVSNHLRNEKKRKTFKLAGHKI